MTLNGVMNGVMAVTLRYFIEFGKPVFQHVTASMWRNSCMSLLYFVVRVRWRRYQSSRSLSHLLMSFLFFILTIFICDLVWQMKRVMQCMDFCESELIFFEQVDNWSLKLPVCYFLLNRCTICCHLVRASRLN